MLKLCVVGCVLLVVTVEGAFLSYFNKGPPTHDTCTGFTEYIDRNAFEDTKEFYETVQDVLTDNLCDTIKDGVSLRGKCKPYSFDSPYGDILDYVTTVCKFGYAKLPFLRFLLTKYCFYRCPPTFAGVVDAYEENTCCELADILNQVCRASVQCPDGYSLFEGTFTCYKFFDIHRNFEHAQARCEMDNGNLVQIDSEPENDFVFDLINDGSATRAYIGLNDRDTEGEYVWVGSGDNATYLAWSNSQPDDRENEDCVIMNWMQNNPNQEDGRWNDVGCGVTRTFVCETDPFSLGNEHK